MSDLQLYHQLTALPDDLKKEVELFIQFLLHRQQQQQDAPKAGKCEFGFAKGKIIVHPNFDEPLEDFKDYV